MKRRKKTHLVNGSRRGRSLLEVKVEPFPRSRLSSPERHGALVPPRVRRVAVLSLVAPLERFHEHRDESLNVAPVEARAVARRRDLELRKRLERLRHLERGSTPVTEGFDALAEGREHVGRVMDCEREVLDVNCGGGQ